MRASSAAIAVSTVGAPYEVLGSSDDRGAWLEARVRGIGASEVAAVLGESAFKSALTLYAEKIGAVEPDDLSDVEAVQWGLRLESVVLDVYAERTGRPSRRSAELLRSTEHPWALATLDGWTSDGVEACWPLEIKTAGQHKASEWESGPPPAYYLQLQHQMLVTGAPRATIACLLGGQRMVWCDVERDEITIRRIIHHGAAFWRCVLERTPPAPDGSESARATLGALYPTASGETVALPASALECAEDLDRLKLEAKALEERIRLIENTIKAAIGDATAAVLPDGTGFSWKEQHMPERTIKASSFRVLRRVTNEPKQRTKKAS